MEFMIQNDIWKSYKRSWEKQEKFFGKNFNKQVKKKLFKNFEKKINDKKNKKNKKIKNTLLLIKQFKNLRLKTKNTRNSFDAKKPKRHHAAKPEEFYNIIEANSYPPYLELFATQRKIGCGWTYIGYELDGKDIKESLREITNEME